jgi:hypothetical protein
MLLVLAALWMSTAQAAEPTTGTLTLACEGTSTETSEPDSKPKPISMGIIVNFTDRTVKGFGMSNIGDLVKVDSANETTIAFSGSSPRGGWTIHGSIDRVTGALEAGSQLWDANTPSNVIIGTGYSLKCKPAQRMF